MNRKNFLSSVIPLTAAFTAIGRGQAAGGKNLLNLKKGVSKFHAI